SRARHIKWLNVFFIVRNAVVEYDGPILTGKLSRALMFPDGPAPGPGQLPPGRAGRPVLPAQGRRLVPGRTMAAAPRYAVPHRTIFPNPPACSDVSRKARIVLQTSPLPCGRWDI